MKIVLVIFILSFLLQVSTMILLGSYQSPQVYEYEQIAINLLTKHTFVCKRLGSLYYSLVPPVYPFLTAAVYYFTNYSHLAMLCVQITFTALLCAVIYLLGTEIFDKRIGIISATLCIFHPGLIFCSTVKLHELSLVSLLFSLLIFVILEFKDNPTYNKSLLTAIALGISILTRATITLFLPLLLIWLWRKKMKIFIYRYFFILLVTTIIISPWIIRNYFIYHKFVFMQTPSIDIWVGNNINASGSNYLKDGRTVLESMPKDFIDKVYAADELAKNKIFTDAVYKFIADHPYKFLSLFFKKLYYFWYFSPQTGIEYPRLYLLIYKFLYSFMFLFGIIGIVINWNAKSVKIRDFTQLVLLLFLAISFGQSLFYVEGRHRWAIEPLLLIFTASGLFYAKEKIQKCLKAKI